MARQLRADRAADAAATGDSKPASMCMQNVGSSKVHDCVHKPLLPDLLAPDIIAMVVIFSIAGLALAVGIGGGGMYVPLLNLLLHFKPHASTGLSQALICGGALGALAVNVRERHPASAARPMIDFGFAAFLAPAEMAGAQLGVMLNHMLPSPVILAMMASLLSVLAYRTLKKGGQQWREEREARRRQLHPSLLHSGESESESEGHAEEGRLLPRHVTVPGASSVVPIPSVSPPTPPAPSPLKPSPSLKKSGEEGSLAAVAEDHSVHLRSRCEDSTEASSAGDSAEASKPASQPPSKAAEAATSLSFAPLARMLAPEAEPAQRIASDRAAPWFEISLLGGVWVGLLAVLLLRGGKGAPSVLGLPTCGGGYWALTFLGFFWLFGISLLGGRRMVEDARLRRAAGEPLLAGDVRWDGPRAAHCLVVAFLAGVLAGLVGVGGGMVLGPLLLDMGVLPQVGAATTGTTVLLTSSSAAAVFLLGALIPADYAFGLGLVALVGAFIGKVVIGALVKRYKAAALITLLLGVLIFISMLASATAGLLDLHAKWESGNFAAELALRTPCGGGH
jgi:uncharacterized membrane protein YfcA